MRPLPRSLHLLIGVCLGVAAASCRRESAPRPPQSADAAPAPDLPAEAPEPPAATDDPKPSVTPLGDERFRIGRIEFDKANRSITIPATVLMREHAVEYLLVTRSGKVHESVFVTDADPRNVHLAALLLGLQPSAELGPLDTRLAVPPEAAIRAQVEWDRNGPPARENLHEMLAIREAGTEKPARPAPPTLWHYNGSRVADDGTFVASRDGSVISIIRDPEALINYPGQTRDDDEIHVPNADKLPKLGHPVRIVLKLR